MEQIAVKIHSERRARIERSVERMITLDFPIFYLCTGLYKSHIPPKQPHWSPTFPGIQNWVEEDTGWRALGPFLCWHISRAGSQWKAFPFQIAQQNLVLWEKPFSAQHSIKCLLVPERNKWTLRKQWSSLRSGSFFKPALFHPNIT